METGLTNKVAIVTGATANIGQAIALALAAEGVRLVVSGRDVTKGEIVTRTARELGAADAMFIPADVLKASEVNSLAAQTLERFGAIDILVNNVGGNTRFELFAESDPESWQDDIDLNLTSTLRCTRAVLPSMIKRKSGRIINIGSTAGRVGDYMLAVYSAAKGAVHNFTRVLAKEVGPYGVTVNCVAPYATFPEDVATETSRGSRYHPTLGLITRAVAERGEELSKLRRGCVLPRDHAKPSEVAAAVVYLASEAAAFVTGQIQYVDGGTLL